MKKFSHISSINESTDNTYLLGKTINNLPEEFMEVSDMFDTFKESYDNVEDVNVAKGYVTNFNLNKSYSVNATQLVGIKKIKQLFPDGNIPDKWILSIKALITFKSFKNDDTESKNLPGWAGDQIFDTSTLDEMINRYRAIKTLSSRCEHYGFKVKVSYGSPDKISVLVFFN